MKHSTRLALFAPLALALGLVACAAPPPPARPAPPRPVAARPPPPPLHDVAATWSFSTATTACTARIAHPDATLTVTAGPEPQVDFVARGTEAVPRINRLAFRGPEGSWWRGMPPRGAEGAGVTQPLSAATERRVRALLAGGTLTYGRPGAPDLRVTLPDAGVSGRDWYGCLARLQAD